MKKSLLITLLIGIILSASIGCGKAKEEKKAKEMASAKEITDISVNDLNDTFTLYHVDELYVLGKYMFVTVDEYYDSDSGYSDDTYYVYTSGEPKRGQDLIAEYYLVQFFDNSGEAHLASLSNRDWDFSEQIQSATLESPVIVSAYVSVAANYEHTELDDCDEEENEIREATLDAASDYYNIPNEHIDMVYKYQ